MRQSVVRNTLLLLALVAIGAVTAATTSQRQVGGFVAELPPQTPAVTQPPAQAGHRHIPDISGTPITSRLEPGDQIVEFVRDAMPFVGPHRGSAEEEIATLMNIASAVAVIEVTKKESAFSSTLIPADPRMSPEDWITSTLTVQVDEVLKDTTGQLVAGHFIEVQESGGEVVLPDGRRIIARSSYVRPSRVGGTYLAVLGSYQGRFFLDGLLSLEFDNGEIKRMRLDAPPDTGLGLKTPEWTTQRARALADRRQR